MTEVICFGISDKCRDPLDNPLSNVGFHDYDVRLNIFDLRNKVDALSKEMGDIPVHALATKHGYHILTFTILTPEEDLLWKRLCRKIFPSNYNDNLCPECSIIMEELPSVKNINGVGYLICRKCGVGKYNVDRILRIDEKEGSKPRLLYSSLPENNRITLSEGHIRVYVHQDIIPNPNGLEVYKTIPTRVRLCQYVTHI